MHNQLRDAQTALSQKTLCLHHLPQLQTAGLLGDAAKSQSRNITLHLTRNASFLLRGLVADFYCNSRYPSRGVSQIFFLNEFTLYGKPVTA